MSKRDPREVEDILRKLKASLRRWPAGAVIAGVVNIDDTKVDHLLGTVDFSPAHYAAAADGLLERAVERMVAMQPPPLDLIMQCQRARAALAFEEEKPHG